MDKSNNLYGYTAVGIDLGTTFCSVSIVNKNSEPEVIPNAEGSDLTPSVVFFDGDISVVGEIAKENVEEYPEKIVMFIKREMGNPAWFYKYQGSRLTPIDISALILKKLKIDSESYLGREITHAVITVPAYFDDDRRRGVMTAGEMAGYKVLMLLNEPTAAAIAFGVEKSEKDETVLVYDLGGGTFDVTLMRVENKGKDIRIIASDGEHQLGGKDFDDAIIRICCEQFESEHGFDPSMEPHELQQIRTDAEKAKIELSTREKAAMLVRGQGQRSRIVIKRETFEEAIKPKLETTLALIRSVLRSSKYKADAIDRILLVGGSTRIPYVQQILKEFFNKEPDCSIDPDKAVAIGAAIMAAKKILEIAPDIHGKKTVEKYGGLQITDVISHSIGIEAVAPNSQKINSILINRNCPLPIEIDKEFVTTIAGQTAIKVKVYQGESQDPNLCNPIGDFILSGLPENRQAGRKVRVTVSCTGNGVIEVAAKDIETGMETQTQINYSSGETKKQVSAKKLWIESQKVE
jgi:molecular chaperone DnaK